MGKRQLIMEKSLELFAKQGFEATSVQQITDYCGISKGAFYLSFKSKDELILALIDHFLQVIISDLDHVVKSCRDKEMLFAFYKVIFDIFNKHQDFAKLFFKEQSQSIHKGFFLKIRQFDTLMDHMILTMLEHLYGGQVVDTKYDLTYCIKGFINTYANLFIFNNLPLDVDTLARSLVEKTDILARYSSIVFLSKEYCHILREGISEQATKEQLVDLLEQLMQEMEDSVEKESLRLLKEQVNELTLSPVLVKGLIENIRNHPHCKWVAYLLGKYFETKIHSF